MSQLSTMSIGDLEPEDRKSLPKRLIHLPSMKLVISWDIKEPVLHLPATETTDAAENVSDEHTSYAVFSHRWSQDEISFQELSQLYQITQKAIASMIHDELYTNLKSVEVINKLIHLSGGEARSSETTLLDDFTTLLPKIGHCTGLVKLIKFCNAAFNDHKCGYAWVDTGCIDKSSSAELEESIRSMFRWYRSSNICVIHLAKTDISTLHTPYTFAGLQDDPWFSRGWTLQELLAPPVIQFYDCNWEPLTSEPIVKSDKEKIDDDAMQLVLVGMISSLTGIETGDICNFKPGLVNIARRMAWASKRTTTRIEDMAYCLLGIFDVSMPIAYGEGNIAFYRLQKATIELTSDRSIFMWTGRASRYSSMLAAGPECFLLDDNSPYIDPSMKLFQDNYNAQKHYPEPTFALTNYGLRIPVSFYPWNDTRMWLRGECLGDNHEHCYRGHWSQGDTTTTSLDNKYMLTILGFHNNDMKTPFCMLLKADMVDDRFTDTVNYTREPWLPRVLDRDRIQSLLPWDRGNVGLPKVIFIR